MVRLFWVFFWGIIFNLLIGLTFSIASNVAIAKPDYSKLLSFIAQEDLQDPLIAFGHATEDFNHQRNQENIKFLNNNKELIKTIQTRINGESIRWRLDNAFIQRLIVPENRDEYAHLFEHYCRASIDFLLDRLQMPTPYVNIATLRGSVASMPDQPSHGGITAYLVHNLADDYIEEYLFFDQENDTHKIKIKLRNRQFDAKIGCYTSHLKIGENNQFEFVRDPYTLWQNSAKNPLNVLIVPIEETLHIIVRPATETAMQVDLARIKPINTTQLHEIINEWMAVEEALVGGIVRQVMPEVLSRFVSAKITDLLPQALADRKQLEQYRLLDQGIQVVLDLGIHDTLALYQNNPLNFKRMISSEAENTNLKAAHTSLLSTHAN